MSHEAWRVWLRATMTERGFTTQEQLADASGINQTTISKYLRLGAMPNAESINRLARALKCPAQDILDLFPVD